MSKEQHFVIRKKPFVRWLAKRFATDWNLVLFIYFVEMRDDLISGCLNYSKTRSDAVYCECTSAALSVKSQVRTVVRLITINRCNQTSTFSLYYVTRRNHCKNVVSMCWSSGRLHCAYVTRPYLKIHWVTDVYRMQSLINIHGLWYRCECRVDSMMLVEEGFKVVSTDASDKMLKYALRERWSRRKEPAFDQWSAYLRSKFASLIIIKIFVGTTESKWWDYSQKCRRGLQKQ